MVKLGATDSAKKSGKNKPAETKAEKEVEKDK